MIDISSFCRYATNVYSKNYSPTTGVDFYLKRTTVAANKNCALKLWDISGRAMQGRMLDKYIFGADAVMLVYDVTNAESFESLQDWLDMSRMCLTGNKAVHCTVCPKKTPSC